MRTLKQTNPFPSKRRAPNCQKLKIVDSLRDRPPTHLHLQYAPFDATTNGVRAFLDTRPCHMSDC